MRANFCKALAPLASLAYQRKYIIGSTKEAYVIPAEVLESVFSNLNRMEKKQEFVSTMTALEKSALENFRRVFKNISPRAPFEDISMSNEDLVERSRPWALIREAARKCLEEMGFDLAAWEKKELSDEK